MNFRTCIYIIFLTGIFSGGCYDKTDMDEQRYSWYSDAPLTVPYRIRIQRFEKGNLIRNSSFETGRIFQFDSISSSFVIDGWQQVGKNIEWVDIRKDSIYEEGEVFSGYRSIKINRHTAPETDLQGDGVISDFIKVIPGNYALSLYARLENIRPQKPRLGIKMFDGINISLLYYDRNKILIKPAADFPYANQTIDNSFKSLSLANFDRIDSVTWSRIYGKSHHFPFQEGDIPSDAHFVKILISLKAVGTLWIDSVDFHYTDRNFSVAETMQQFTDTTFMLTDDVIPSPKKFQLMESVIFFSDSLPADEWPVIVVEKNVGKLVMDAAEMLQNALQSNIRKHTKAGSAGNVISIVDHLQTQQEGHSKLVISLGKSELFIKNKSILRIPEINSNQGYYIQPSTDNPRQIYLNAQQDIGIYYAALTAIQMIDCKTPVFHSARVLDYPDFPLRFVTMNSFHAGNKSDLIQYKLNGAVVFRKEGEAILATDAKQPLFSLVQADGYTTPDDSSLMGHLRVENGPGSIGKSPLQIPAIFNNEILDQSTSLSPLIESEGIRYIYTGASFFSNHTDRIDLLRYTSAMKTMPVFMDNSMLMATDWGQFNASAKFYPGKIRLFNLFEPYSNEEIREFSSLMDANLLIVNLPANSEIAVIRLATAADFMWNGAAYSKNLSLWKVLCSRYGTETARLIILYAEKYSVLLEVLMKAGMNIQPAKNLKTGQSMITELTAIVAKISERIGPRSKLVIELQHMNAGLRNRINLNSSLIPVKK